MVFFWSSDRTLPSEEESSFAGCTSASRYICAVFFTWPRSIGDLYLLAVLVGVGLVVVAVDFFWWIREENRRSRIIEESAKDLGKAAPNGKVNRGVKNFVEHSVDCGPLAHLDDIKLLKPARPPLNGSSSYDSSGTENGHIKHEIASEMMELARTCSRLDPITRVTICSLFLVVGLYLYCQGQDLEWAARIVAVTGTGLALSPYLFKMSRYRSDPHLSCDLALEDVERSIFDKLVFTSLIYIVPALYGVVVKQYGIAFLQTVTTCGSTLFHRSRETRFFNLDNIGAISLLFVTLWGFILAIQHHIWYYVGVVGAGIPLAGYLLVACGMPGVIFCNPNGCGRLRRVSNPDYDHYHNLWHIVSGLGTIFSIHYFETEFPHLDAGGGHFYYFPDVPVVAVTCMSMAALINIYGNARGALPLS